MRNQNNKDKFNQINYNKMKKYISFIAWFIATLVSVMFGGGVAMAAFTPGENGSDTDPNLGTPAEGTTPDAEGKGLDQQSHGTSGSAAQQMGFIDNEVNDYVSKHYAYENALQTDLMREAQQIKVTTPEPAAWEVGEAILDCVTDDDTAKAEGPITLALAKNDIKLFKESATVLVEGVEGYNEAGTATDGTPLILYVEEVSRANGVVASALNGLYEDSKWKVPAIPSGTKLHIMEVALSESEVEVQPDNAAPQKAKVYLQKKVCSITYTDLFKQMRKEAKWDVQDVKDWVLRMFRVKCSRNLLIGKAKKWTKPGTKRTGEEFVYTEEGVLRQLKVGYQLAPTGITFNDLIAISSIAGGKYSIADEYDVYCGTQFMENLHRIDFVKHPEIQFKRLEEGVTKIKISRFESGFTNLNFKKEHALDGIGLGDSAMLFSIKKSKHYYIPHEDIAIDHRKGEGGEVREAKSEFYILEDALKLTQLNSMFISPRSSLVDDSYLDNVELNIESVEAFPENPSDGDIVSLVCTITVSETDGVSGETTSKSYPAGLYKYNATDTIWEPYELVITA